MNVLSLTVEDANKMISTSTSSVSTFGTDISLENVHTGTTWEFTMINSRETSYYLTFYEPIGISIVMSIFIQRANGGSIAGIVGETISESRDQGVMVQGPISGIVGKVIVTSVQREAIHLNIQLQTYERW